MSTQKSIAILGIVAVIGLGALFGTLPNALVSAQQTNSSSMTSTNSTGGNSVSIVPNASTMADKAFAPNPLDAKVGDTVTWTNKDTTLHTVTSGTGPNDPNMKKAFDSGISTLAPSKTFSHTFITAGEFPYFCQLHPTMVGKVVVK